MKPTDNADIRAQKIEQFRTNEQKQRLRECDLKKHQEALVELAKAKNVNGVEFHSGLKVTTEVVARTVDVPRVSVWMFNEEQSRLSCIELYESGTHVHSNGANVPTDAHYVSTIEHSRGLRISDTLKDDRLRDALVHLVTHDITSLLDAPIRSGGKTIGLLRLAHVGARRDWTIDEENFACSVADLIALNYEKHAHHQTQGLIQHITYHDDLTGLPNRKALEQQLHDYLEHARLENHSFAVMFIDLDNFSFVNNSFGHLIGDELLRQVANRLLQSHGDNGALSRISGDQFILLISELTHLKDAETSAERILKLLEPPVVINGNPFHLTCSVGITFYPDGGTDGVELLKNADIALHHAKEQGKNQYQVYQSTMNVETYKRFIMRNDLHRVVEEHSLLVHYQPRVNPFSNRITSAEALIRWEHPEWGLVAPDEFIPLAEENGLILSIGEWMLRNVCSQNKSWQDAGFVPIPISVNISGKQLMQTGFVDTVVNVLHETGLDGKWLELEITENTILNNEELIRNTIQDLQAHGVKVVVDDFGKGHSSLSRLKQFHFDTVKLDKSFIQGLDTDSTTTTITSTMIELAHTIGMNIVVEGVESEEQASFLRKHKCDEIQGYFYSRPVPVNEFLALLKNGTCEPRVQMDVVNRRQFFRLNFEYPLLSDMTIDTVQGNKVTIGATEVLIEDIGPGGLRFLSKIRLPVNENIVLKLNTTIFSDVELYGLIVWNDEPSESIFEYGLRFIMNEQSSPPSLSYSTNYPSS